METHNGLPLYKAVFDENNPDHGVKSIQLVFNKDAIERESLKFNKPIMETEKKQSGYQKLRAEKEELKAIILELEARIKQLTAAPESNGL